MPMEALTSYTVSNAYRYSAGQALVIEVRK